MSISLNTHFDKYWNHGVPMTSSWLKFAHADGKARWNKAQEPSALDVLARDAKIAGQSDAPLDRKVMSAFAGMQAILAERTEIEMQLKADIVRYVRAEKLLVYGFEAPRSMTANAVEIPTSAWSGRLDWSKSKITHQSLTFVEIRLIAPSWRDQLLGLNTQSGPLSAARAGRPSIATDVRKAFEELKRNGEIDILKSAKWHFRLIRDQMRRASPDEYPPERKLSDEGIRRYFSSLFKDLKANKKQ